MVAGLYFFPHKCDKVPFFPPHILISLTFKNCIRENRFRIIVAAEHRVGAGHFLVENGGIKENKHMRIYQ